MLMELSCQFFLATPHTDTKVYSDTTKAAFYSTLSKAIKTIKLEYPGFKLIVGGDFNATIGRDCERDKWAFVGNN